MPQPSPAPEPAAPKAVRLPSERAQPSIFWVLAGVVLPILGLMARFRVEDGGKLPMRGAVVLAPNHYSEIDPVVIGAVVWKLGRIPRFLAKGSLFRVPVLGWFLRKSGQIPVERAGTTRGNAPLTAAQRVADDGNVVIVYPEGSLTRDPELWPMRGKSGAARMALKHGIPVIPVAHWGTQQVMARYSKKVHLFPPRTIRVKFGDPVDLSAFRDRPLDGATLTEATEAIMAAVTSLLEDLRGEKAPRERWDPSAHDQKETGRFDG